MKVSPTTTSLASGETQQFAATVTGTNNTNVNWSASGGTITSSGVYTAPTAGGGYVIRATSAADSNASGTAIVNVTGSGSAVLEPFYDSADPYVQLMSPMPYATYFAPATIRMWAHAPDYGNDNVNQYSPQVDFYIGTTMVKSVKIGVDDPVDYYEADITGVAAGSYELYVRSVLDSGTVESVHVPITVVDAPTQANPSMDLTSDLVLSGNMDFELIGTPTARALLTSSNGSRIRSASGWTGHFKIQNADIIGLGSMDVPGIEITVSGNNALEISDSVFDRCGPPSLTADDQAPVTIRGNTFQPNILTSANDQPDYQGSHPSLVLGGNSSASKVFQANNVGVSYVQFASSHWLIGGDHDTDSNVIIGVRGGMEIDSASDITIRGNFSYHRYPFGWSQGHNLDFEGNYSANPKVLVEHNIFRSSSWMIQGLPGEFRYNLLVDNINEAFFRSFAASVKVHHNVLVNASFQRLYLPSGGVLFADGEFYSNTIDVGGAMLGWFNNAFIPNNSKLKSVRNNVFSGFAYQDKFDVIEKDATMSADYNCFYNPDTTDLTRYGNSGFGAHDCGGGASTDPKFSQMRVTPFPIADGDLWRRTVTVSEILALYRGIYTPGDGSPLIDAGDPQDDAVQGTRSTDIGAVGAGNPDPNDLFGSFGS